MISSGDKQFYIGSTLDPDAVRIGSESGNIVTVGIVTATDFVTTGQTS
jgi:hypothetical protein